MSTERNWLKITEYISLAVSAVGTVVAAVSGQAIMAVTGGSLTTALSLNLLDRQRLQQQIQLDTNSAIAQIDRIVQSLRQEVDKLPKQPVDLTPINQSFLDLEEFTQLLNNRQEQLSRQFQTRPEIEAIQNLEKVSTALREQLTVLGVRFDNLPLPQTVDLNPMAGEIGNLRAYVENLSQEFNSRPEIVKLPQIQGENSKALEKVEAEINHLREQVIAVNQQFIEVRPLLGSTQENIAQLNQKEAEINQLREQILTLAEQFAARTELQVLPEIQQENRNAIAQLNRKEVEINQLREQILALSEQFATRTELQGLPEIQQEDRNAIAQLEGVEAEINHLREQMLALYQQFDDRIELQALPEIQQENRNAIAQIHQLEAEINQLQEEMSGLTQQFNSIPEISAQPEIQQENRKKILQLEKLLEGEINYLRSQMSALTEYIGNRS